MTTTDKDYAALDKDSYKTHKIDDKVILNGVAYKVIDYINNPITGYRGTAYQRIDTKEVVVTNRGTEPHGDGKYQDIITDMGMVLTGLNAQMPDARAFATRVKSDVAKSAALYHYPVPPITVTGHSLGGAITEILAYEMHWRGVTINGYGAADMGYHVPEGGTQVTNYVRATDVVSAASHHYGKVVLLATQQDIDQLANAGYHDKVTATSLRNPLSAISFAAHSIDNFAPDNPDLTPSDLSPENEARARAHGPAIHLFREDIQSLRANTLSLPWELKQKQETARHLADSTLSATIHGDFATAGKIADLAGHRTAVNVSHALETTATTVDLAVKAIDRADAYAVDDIKQRAADFASSMTQIGQSAAQSLASVTKAMHLNHPHHPDHAMYLQARTGVHKLDAEQQRTYDQRSDQLAAALVVAAVAKGLDRIDKVQLTIDADHVFALKSNKLLWGPSMAGVPTVQALNTPIEQSSKAWEQAMQAKAQEAVLQHQQQAQQTQQPLTPQHSQGMSR
ncbi:MAG: XVIPCD domain-containing protein [Rhodanobacter sp.]